MPDLADPSPRPALLAHGFLTENADLREGLRRVAAAGCLLLSNCKASSVTIIQRGKPTTVASTNDIAVAIDEVQYAADSGPCLTAARNEQKIRIDEISADSRWPEFRQRAIELDIKSSLSIPLHLAVADHVGGLNIYGAVESAFTEDDELVVEAFATQASIVVTNTLVYWSTLALSSHLTAAMESRAAIEQAKGMLMARHGVSADEAFDLLRRRSQAENRKLRQIAQEMVDSATAPG